MTFVIVILFATMGDLYVFTKHTFETRNECMEFLLKEESKELILSKLYMVSLLVLITKHHTE